MRFSIWTCVLIGSCVALLVGMPIYLAVHQPDDSAVLVAQSMVAALLGVVVATTYRRVVHRARRHQRLNEAVAELGRRALSVQEPDELLGEALRVAVEAIGADYGTAIRRLEGDTARLAAEVGPDPLPQGTLLPLDPTHSYVKTVMENGDSFISADLRIDSRVNPPSQLLERGVISSMAVPVFGPDSTVGLLGLHSVDANRFSTQDVVVLQALATVAATAWAQASHREAMNYLALHDAMTHLPNRSLFFDRLDHALSRLFRRPEIAARGTAVMVMDVDNFKNVNDTLGHATGDEVLIRIAERLREVVRPADTVARLGGDEFALLCDPAPPDDALNSLAQRLRAHVGEPMTIEGSLISVTMSVGVALTRSPVRFVHNASCLMQEADAALYQAKRSGEGLCVFDAQIHQQVRTRVQLEADLQHGLQHDEFFVHYHPVRDPASRRILGVEALMRWRHPEHGLLMPDQFLEVAERTGLIIPLGMHILRTACTQMALWQQRLAATHSKGGPTREPLWVAVNLSSRQLDDPNLAEKVAQALHSTGLTPQCLHVELTEAAVMGAGQRALEALRQLRGIGVTVALDDFGTGYSSLTHLARLPIQVLKVDRSFVAGIGLNERDTAVVSSVAALGRQLGLRVIAEGVETPEQLLQVITLQCYGAQGYLLDHPGDAATLEGGALKAMPSQLGPFGPARAAMTASLEPQP